MPNKEDWKDKLKDRLHKAEIVHHAKELHHDEQGIADLCATLLTSTNKRLASNAAWILSHLSQEDKDIYVLPFYHKLVDMAMSDHLQIRRGLILSVIVNMPFTECFRADLFDFCLNKMTDRKENDSSRSVMIKLAARMCCTYPELKNELSARLELLSDEQKPSISAACRNALKFLRKQIKKS